MSRTWLALRWLLLPWWLLQVFSGEKAFHPNPILGSPALNRWGLFVWRGRLAERLTALRRRKLAHLVNEADRSAFDRDGFILKPDFAPPDLFRRLVEEVEGFRGRAGEFKEGDAITRRIPLTPENLRRLPACKALLDLPAWRGLTRYVSSFDAEPQVSIQTIFTKVDDGPRDPQTSMHTDTFHSTMKAWLFLEDVAEEDGPFCYVPGAHRRTRRREVWERRKSIEASDPRTRRKGGAFRVTRAELARLKAPEPRRFPVRANTLVVADTHGFHARSPSARPSARVEIWASSRRNPFTPFTGAGGSSGALRGFGVALAWRLVELRRRFGLPAPQFRQVAATLPKAPPEPWTRRPTSS